VELQFSRLSQSQAVMHSSNGHRRHPDEEFIGTEESSSAIYCAAYLFRHGRVSQRRVSQKRAFHVRVARNQT
jgi:hypothetical protein